MSGKDTEDPGDTEQQTGSAALSKQARKRGMQETKETPQQDSQADEAKLPKLQNKQLDNVQTGNRSAITKQPGSVDSFVSKKADDHEASSSSSSGDQKKNQVSNGQDSHTGGTEGQDATLTQTVKMNKNITMDKTRLESHPKKALSSSSSDEQQKNQVSNGQASSSSSSDDQKNNQASNDQDSHTGGTEGQDATLTQTVKMNKNITMDKTGLESHPKKALSSSSSDEQQKNQVSNGQASSSSSSDDQKNNQASNDQNTDTASDKKTQPSAPEDVAKYEIKVDWKGEFPVRWEKKLHKALQTWLSKLKGTASVQSIKLINEDEPSWAEVQITPSIGVEILRNHTSECLIFKEKDGKDKGDKEVTAKIKSVDLYKGQFVNLRQKPQLEEKKVLSPEVNISMPVTSAEANPFEDIAASNRASKKTETIFPLPLSLTWYMNYAYKKELKQIEKQHGVCFCAEVSVSIIPTENSSHDSACKASNDFQKLLQGCMENFTDTVINHNDMDSDTVKEAINAIQLEETKMMFTMSASNCLFFGPKKFTDVIKTAITREETQLNDKSSPVDVDNDISPQRRSPLHMVTNDLPTQLEMDKVHWDLMKLSYEEQLSQLKTKYGVSFHEEKLQKNVLKVQARSKRDQHINLESHALRALTQLYQKLASAVVSCELMNPADKTDVATLVEKLQQQHCVVVADGLSSWKLVGLPEHLGPAIADIEKKLQKNVFNDKMKKVIGYSFDIPQTRGIRRNQTPDHGPGAVAGAGRDERVNFRGQDEADTGFNEDSKDSRYDSKGAQAEEETCTICMDSFTDKTKLKCGHEFCQECIKMSVKSLGPICPVCKEVFGRLEGNQPDGTMKVTKSRLSLPGYPQCGTIEIHYDIYSGIQTDKHPNPGKPYHGTYRSAYLPDNNEGNEVLRLLQMAFQQKLIFTVGTSTTTGVQNAVTWNDIHHKTNTYGGPQNYGYPDHDYLKRVKDELKAKGIE